MSSAEQPYGPLVDTTISVATWNVWGRFGPWPQRQRGVVETLRGSGADVVLLQETWFDDTGADQAPQLAGELGFSHCSVGGPLLYGDWGPGIAVLSRWPISGVELHELPALTADGWGGLAQRVVIEGPRRPMLVYNVALDWPPQASAARQHAVHALAGTIAADPLFTKALLVVGGDFNAGPDSDEVRMLLGRRETAHPDVVLFDAWLMAGHADPGATWSRKNPWAAPNLLPDQRIDHILTGWPRRGGVGSVTTARLLGTEPHDGVVPSDHYGVLVQIRY